MDSTYFFSAFGTFGNPNGFRQSYFLGGNAETVKHIRTFDLKTDAVQLFPGSRVYGMRLESAGSSCIVSYTVYSFAKEQNSQRGGTFIGSSLIFVDKTAPESLTIDVLEEFHQYLERHNVDDGTIAINHSDKFSIHMPKDYDKINLNARPVESLGVSQSGNNYLMVYTGTGASQLQTLFSKALGLLTAYDMIYFTESREVAEFVQHKGIFKIVDLNGFDREIQKSQEEKLRMVTSFIHDLEKEKENLKGDKKTIIDDLERQISQNERRHQENEKKISESKSEIAVIHNEFDQYAAKMDTLINTLKSDEKVEAVRKLHLESRKTFADKIRQGKDFGALNSISPASPFPQRNVKPPLGNDLEDFRRDHSENKKRGLNGYKIAFWSLLLLMLAGICGYLVLLDQGKIRGFAIEEKVAVADHQSDDTLIKEPAVSETPAVLPAAQLNPFPNDNLNENDWRLVAKKAVSGIKIDSLINIIYKENPSAIKDYYKHQRKDYKAHLYSLNEKSFGIIGQDTVMTDTLRKIPNYQKPGSLR